MFVWRLYPSHIDLLPPSIFILLCVVIPWFKMNMAVLTLPFTHRHSPTFIIIMLCVVSPCYSMERLSPLQILSFLHLHHASCYVCSDHDTLWTWLQRMSPSPTSNPAMLMTCLKKSIHLGRRLSLWTGNTSADELFTCRKCGVDIIWFLHIKAFY